MAGEADAAGGAGVSVPESAFPHSPQNLVPGAFGYAQYGQVSASCVPQLPQNLRPDSFSVPQLVHVSRASGSYYRERKYRSGAP